MNISFDKAVSGAWAYAKNKERIAVTAGMYALVIALVVLPFLMFSGSLSSLGIVGSFVKFMPVLALGIIAALLLSVFVNVMLIHNYADRSSLSNSASYSKGAFLKVVLASLIIGGMSFAAALIPILGIILAILLGFMFYFVEYEIVLARTGVFDSLSKSYGIFRENKINILLTMLLSGVLGFLLLLAFAIPFLLVFFGSLVSSVSGGGATSGSVGAAFAANMPLLMLTGLILLAGVAFASLFMTGIKTDVYMQIKKMRIAKA